MHLFAISGLHIAAIAAVIYGVLALVRLPRVVQWLAGAVLLWLYTDITGGTPSAVRAFIMVSLLHASRVLRVPGNPLAALAVSAVVVLVIEPMQVFSASFQLSYGIVAALLLMGLPLAAAWQERLALFKNLPPVSWSRAQRWLEAGWRGFLAVLALGVTSTLISLVAGVAMFDLLTPGSLVANLVLIPVSTLVIWAGFLALVCGLAGLGGLAVVFNYAGVVVLAGIDAAVRGFVRVPGTHLPASFVQPWLGYAAFACVLMTMLWGQATRWELKRGGFWPPVAVVVAALVLGMRFG